MKTEPTPTSYIVLALQAPIVVTLKDTSVFEAKHYRITHEFLHCSGEWKDGGNRTTTLMVPMTSVLCIDFESTQVDEADVPESQKASVKFQVEKLETRSQ